ncbi:MAG: DMT family transporter [Deltaproteobacteria bacterium]|nr:DMT family transporter [Deltaproteobacteria bacterium]
MKYIFLGLFSAFLFGLSTPLSKVIISSTDPMALASLYYLASAFILIPFALPKMKTELEKLKTHPKDIGRLLGTFIFGGILAPVFLLSGLRSTAAASASLLLNLETAATASVAHFLFKERLMKRDWLGALGIITAGSILVFEKGWVLNPGSLWIVGACFCWGLDNNFTAKIRAVSPTTNAFLKGLVAGFFNMVLAFALHSKWPALNHDLLGVLLIGMLSFGISIALYITCARKIGAFRSQVLFATSPFWGVSVALLFLHEKFILQQALATVLLVSSLALIFSTQRDSF